MQNDGGIHAKIFFRGKKQLLHVLRYVFWGTNCTQTELSHISFTFL